MANDFLECIIFNVAHGQSVFINSPNGYNLLIDCGQRAAFSPIKWIRKHYNSTVLCGKQTANMFEGKNIAMFILSHLHLDHYDDIVSFSNNDGPARLLRDKAINQIIKDDLKKEGDENRKKAMETLLDMDERYSETAIGKIDWGFDEFYHTQPNGSTVETRDGSARNNRSYVVTVKYAGKKILIPGDMEISGWELALQQESFQKLVAETIFFVAAHHGHKSGFTKKILDYSGIPDLFIVSAKSGDENIDTAYSQSKNSRGYKVDDEQRHMVSTRCDAVKGAIKIIINSSGDVIVTTIACDDHLNENQQKHREKQNSQFVLQNWE